MDLKEIQLRGRTGARVIRCTEACDFRGRDFSFVHFINAELANLTGAVLYKCLAKGAKGAIEIEAASSLEDISLENADLSGMNFEKKDLRGVDFRNANLWDSDFSYANLSGASLERAEVDYADFEYSEGLTVLELHDLYIRGARGLYKCTECDTLTTDSDNFYTALDLCDECGAYCERCDETYSVSSESVETADYPYESHHVACLDQCHNCGEYFLDLAQHHLDDEFCGEN